MSHRSKQAAMSRRTRRADQQKQPAPARSTMVSSNPIFFRKDGCPEADTVHVLMRDDVPAAVGKPLPLPPSRTHLPVGSRAGSALLMSKHGNGWVVRRVPRDDPFLAAYVACTKSGGGKVDAPVKQQHRKQKKNNNRGDAVQGCGIWSGWATGGMYKYAGAMSCKYGCDVARPAAAVPRLHLSRQLVVIPARERALARERAQG